MACFDVSGMERPMGKLIRPDIIVVHENNGKKYFEALVQLHIGGSFGSLEFVESTVIRKAVRGLLREKSTFKDVLRRAFVNLIFRIKVPFLKNKIIVFGAAPWDFRLIYYAQLRKKNRFIYHTSWPFWSGEFVARSYGPLSKLMRYFWCRELNKSDIEIVAVNNNTATALEKAVIGKISTVIPHAVSDTFFSCKARYSNGIFNLIYVGDLIEQKGIKLFPQLLDQLSDINVHLHIVGAGPLEEFVASDLSLRHNVTVHGCITDREVLASLFFCSQLLVLPSVRSQKWEELFGMVIVEAMAAGLPSMASDHIGPRSLIKHNLNGMIFSEGDVGAMAEIIRDLASNEEKWVKMSDHARDYGKKYRISNIQDEWRELLYKYIK